MSISGCFRRLRFPAGFVMARSRLPASGLIPRERSPTSIAGSAMPPRLPRNELEYSSAGAPIEPPLSFELRYFRRAMEAREPQALQAMKIGLGQSDGKKCRVNLRGNHRPLAARLLKPPPCPILHVAQRRAESLLWTTGNQIARRKPMFLKHC